MIASKPHGLLESDHDAYIHSTQGDANLADEQIQKPFVSMKMPKPYVPQTDLAKQFIDFVEGVKALGAKIMEGFTIFYGHVKKGELIENSGWLPHYTSPFDQIELHHAPDAVGEVIDRYYRENWEEVKAQFIIKLATYNVDDEAKETFVEALQLHEKGHYRAVVRLLFPEIERVARKEVYDGKMGIASLKELREAAGHSLGLSTFGSIQYSLNLFSRVSKHLYEHVTDQAAIERYTNDPVPNRHASLHGIVIYKKVNNSMNAIIMAEMMLAIVSDLKEIVPNNQPSSESD